MRENKVASRSLANVGARIQSINTANTIMLDDQLPSSPPQGASPEETIAYYKTQYEQLESELADFQASSQELEAELEKDVEAAEKRERHLQEKVESLGFEVEEWKVRCTLQRCMLVAVRSVADLMCRLSINNQRPRQTLPRTYYRRRSLPFEIQPEVYN